MQFNPKNLKMNKLSLHFLHMAQTKAKLRRGYKIKDTHSDRTLRSLAESQISTEEFSEVKYPKQIFKKVKEPLEMVY
jgi:hypothetical protein